MKDLLHPPVFDDEDTTRIAGLLHIMLLSLILVLGTYTVLKVLRFGYGISTWANVSLMVLAIGLFFLMRRGHVIFSGFMILLVSWLNLSVQAWLLGGIRDSSFTAYFLLVVGAGLLLGRWFCIGFSVLSLVSGGILAHAEATGVLPFAPDQPYALWIDQSINLVFLTIFLVLASNSLTKSLERARRGERELAEKNQELETVRASLEKRVVERTRQLAEQNAKLQLEIEERHQAQTALKEALDREHSMLEDLRLNLSLTLPHELRTPLNAILGFSEVLRNPKTFLESEKIVKYANGIHKGAVRLHKLVENTLLYANLRFLQYARETPHTTSTQRAYPLKSIITESAWEYARNVGRENDLRMNLEDLRIFTSPEHVKKIVIEVLENAFKFSSPGTPVEVITQRQGQGYVLRITDQGRGMSPEQIEAIGGYMQFERRYYEQQGMGLGLTIASLLTQLEGGTLTLKSEKHQGTTVTLNFEYCLPIE